MTKTQTARTMALIAEKFGFIRSKIKLVHFSEELHEIELAFKVNDILYHAYIDTANGLKRLDIIEPKYLG